MSNGSGAAGQTPTLGVSDVVRKPGAARKSFWCSNFKDDAVMEALVVQRPSGDVPQPVPESQAAAKEPRAPMAEELVSAATLEACGLPVLAERCGQEALDQKFAVEMVFLLREALAMLCEQLKEATRYNELVERQCLLYDAQIKRAVVVDSKNGLRDHERPSATPAISFLSATPKIEPAPASTPRGPGRPGEAFSPPTRIKTDEVLAAAAAPSSIEAKTELLTNGKCALAPHERRFQAASSSSADTQELSVKIDGDEELVDRLQLAGFEASKLGPRCESAAKDVPSTELLGSSLRQNRRHDTRDTQVSVNSAHSRQRVSFLIESASSEGSDDTEESVSASSSSVSASSGGGEHWAPLTSAEIDEIHREFACVSGAMNKAEEDKSRGSTQSTSPSFKDDAKGLDQDPATTLLAGRKTMHSYEQVQAAMRGDFGEVRSPGAPKKSDFFAKRRTAIAVAAGDAPDLSHLGSAPAFFAGRRTAVSIASTSGSGGRFSVLATQTPAQTRPTTATAPGTAPGTASRGSISPNTSKIRFAPGLAEGNAPPRRLTLFQGGGGGARRSKTTV